MKLKLDLHDIYNRGGDIDHALRAIINEAVAKKAPLVEIIPGKGSGALKKHVLRFLEQKEIKSQYHRVEKDWITSVGSLCTFAGNDRRRRHARRRPPRLINLSAADRYPSTNCRVEAGCQRPAARRAAALTGLSCAAQAISK